MLKMLLPVDDDQQLIVPRLIFKIFAYNNNVDI